MVADTGAHDGLVVAVGVREKEGPTSILEDWDDYDSRPKLTRRLTGTFWGLREYYVSVCSVC